MSMNNSVRNAVGVALLLAAGSALAYVPTSNTDADVVIYWGGATASTLSAQELTVASVCDTDPHLLYVKSTTTDAAGNDWAVACRTAAAGATISGLPNSLRVMVVKRDRGGSGVGVGPLQVNTAIPFLTVNAANCSVPAALGGAIVGGVNGAPAIVNPDGGLVPLAGCVTTAYTTLALTEIGTSDIEPNKFFGINTPIVDLSPSGTATVNQGFPFVNGVAFQSQVSLAALTFNAPVTLNLYRALQTAQFPVTSVCNPANAAFTTLVPPVAGVNPRTDVTNAESEACMPSLTREEINSILVGRVVTWNQLLSSTGAALLPAVSVQICRRVEGSGSQATLNALVSSWPCDANAADGSIDIVPPRNVASAQLVLNSGSGDVDNCLHNFNATANPNAIGVLSVEGRNTQLNRNWRYIKVDGVAPTLRNIHAGDYWFWAQQSAQLRLSTLSQNAAVGASDTFANKTTIFNALTGGVNGLNSMPTLRKLNGPTNLATCVAGGAGLSSCGSLYSFGQSGWLATATAALPYDAVLLNNPADAARRPINAFTREVSTGRPNICQTPNKSNLGAGAARGMIVSPNPTWTP